MKSSYKNKTVRTLYVQTKLKAQKEINKMEENTTTPTVKKTLKKILPQLIGISVIAVIVIICALGVFTSIIATTIILVEAGNSENLSANELTKVLYCGFSAFFICVLMPIATIYFSKRNRLKQISQNQNTNKEITK
jgi:TRAP-type uncharacterized transport system fused permease subunit